MFTDCCIIYLYDSGGGSTWYWEDGRGRADHQQPVPQLPGSADADSDSL